jgi:hypothetical protein
MLAMRRRPHYGRIAGKPEVIQKRGSRKLAYQFKPKQLKLALMLGAHPMNPFFYSEEAGAKGLPLLSPAPQSPPNLPPLRCGQFRLTIPNTYSTITMPASLRSDCCSPSLRNAVRLPSGIDVHLHRNTHAKGQREAVQPGYKCLSV